MLRLRKLANLFRYFNSSHEVIWLVVLIDIRLPLSLRAVKARLFERGIGICHDTGASVFQILAHPIDSQSEPVWWIAISAALVMAVMLGCFVYALSGGVRFY